MEKEVPEAIPPEASYLGWQESLALLAKLVEAEISDQRQQEMTQRADKTPFFKNSARSTTFAPPIPFGL